MKCFPLLVLRTKLIAKFTSDWGQMNNASLPNAAQPQATSMNLSMGTQATSVNLSTGTKVLRWGWVLFFLEGSYCSSKWPQTCHRLKDDLERMSGPPASVGQVAGTTGMCHYAWLPYWGLEIFKNNFLYFWIVSLASNGWAISQPKNNFEREILERLKIVTGPYLETSLWTASHIWKDN